MVLGSVMVVLAHARMLSSSAWVLKEGALASLYIRHLSMQVDQLGSFLLNSTRDFVYLNDNLNSIKPL